jgi:adenylate cyclase
MAALNADIVGYSRLLADDYDATTERVSELRSLVHDAVESAGGTVANFVGDNFMAVFPTSDAAVATAIGITRQIEERNADVPESRLVRFRMGLDAGPVGVADDGAYHGDALNTAARIQALAPAGGVSISDRVYRDLDEPALRFRPAGTHHLKNIPEPVGVHEFADLPTGSLGERPSTLALEAPTLAILPIHTEMVDDEVRAAAQLVRADLLHRLASIPELVVVDSPDQPQGQLATTARYMLETGVHQFGDQIRVFAAVFDVTTMNVVKAHKWNLGAGELFEMADTISDDVARTIEVELVVGAPAGLYAELGDAAAIEKIYLGWYHLRSDTLEGWQRALDLFEEVAESHPDHPFGFVLAAFAVWIGTASGWAEGDAALDRALSLADRGLQVGDPTGMARMVQAAVMMSRGEYDAAVNLMDDMEIIRPTCDVTYGLEGSLRRYMGEWERAVDLVDRAMRLTGINKPWYPTVKACSLFVGGRHEQAVSIAEEVLEYQPNNLEALLVLAAAQTELGLERRARATGDRIRERFPAVDVEAWIDRMPYRSREIVERMKHDLVAAGAIGD